MASKQINKIRITQQHIGKVMVTDHGNQAVGTL